MSQGGGTQTTVQQPWSGAQPYLAQLYQGAGNLIAGGDRRQYYPGSTVVPGLPSEAKAFGAQQGYDASIFGPNGPFAAAMGANTKALTGNTDLGSMSSALSGDATSKLISGIASGPSSVGRYGFDPNLDIKSLTPEFGQGGGMDATGALNQMLNGTPDYSGVKASIDQANQPLLDQFNNELLPGLNSRATFLNNGTGGIKTLATAIPQLGARMSQNALAVTEAERQRALASRDSAAQLVANGGLAAYGLGLQGATAQAGLGRDLAGLNLQTDTTNAGLQGNYLSNLLNYGSLAGGLAGGASGDAARAAGLFPGLATAGQQPSTDLLSYANYQRGLAEDSLSDRVNAYNYNRDQPYNDLSWLSSLITPGAGLGGTTSTTAPGGSKAAGALGGALSGAAAGSTFGPYGTALGALLGGAGGYFYSDRRLKTDIRKVGKLDSGLPIYSYRMKGGGHRILGVMADEAKKKFPTAVVRGPAGFDMVNYGALA